MAQFEIPDNCTLPKVVINGHMNSKRKGNAGERELAKILKEYGFEARRGQQFCGANGDADVEGLDGIHIEVKRVEKLNLYNAMAQSQRDARDGEVPIVAHRRNRDKWLVTIALDDWIEMYKRWYLPFA